MPFFNTNLFAKGKPVNPLTNVDKRTFHHPDSPYLLTTTPFQRALGNNAGFICLLALAVTLLLFLLFGMQVGAWALLVTALFWCILLFGVPQPIDAGPVYGFILIGGVFMFMLAASGLILLWLS